MDLISINEAWCPVSNPLVNLVMCGFSKTRNILTKMMKKYGWKYKTPLKKGLSVTINDYLKKILKIL